jgi:replicative DNA helicase
MKCIVKMFLLEGGSLSFTWGLLLKPAQLRNIRNLVRSKALYIRHNGDIYGEFLKLTAEHVPNSVANLECRTT